VIDSAALRPCGLRIPRPRSMSGKRLPSTTKSFASPFPADRLGAAERDLGKPGQRGRADAVLIARTRHGAILAGRTVPINPASPARLAGLGRPRSSPGRVTTQVRRCRRLVRAGAGRRHAGCPSAVPGGWRWFWPRRGSTRRRRRGLLCTRRRARTAPKRWLWVRRSSASSVPSKAKPAFGPCSEAVATARPRVTTGPGAASASRFRYRCSASAATATLPPYAAGSPGPAVTTGRRAGRTGRVRAVFSVLDQATASAANGSRHGWVLL